MEQTTKLKRGQKLCKSCGGINAARQQVCRHCDNEFLSKNTPLKGEILDWKDLTKGQTFRVINGSGPYFLVKRTTETAAKGEKIGMGHHGVFRVDSVEPKGINAYGITKKNGGYAFIYMGEDTVSKAGVLNLSKHRIVRVKVRTSWC